MTARTTAFPTSPADERPAAARTLDAQPADAADDPLLHADRPLDAAREYLAATSLRASPDTGRLVGLELEMHLVDLAHPARRPNWPEVLGLVAALPPMPSGSSVTLEPGGQVELSTPPALGVSASVAALAADRQVLGDALRAAGFGLAPLGADPARPPRRINPSARYIAMETHFDALGCSDAGRAMMTSTAALQVNLDAGPASGWAQRLTHLDALGPVLVAVSACSPLLGGTSSGWRSCRQQAWSSLDPRRAGPVAGPDPVATWIDFALDAPVMLVRDTSSGTADGPVRPVTARVGFAEWLRGTAPFDRRPTCADLDYHLTTLFPPVRPRGYLELRYLDAVPDRWWPALTAVTVALADHPIAADLAAEQCEPVRGRWTAAARDGLDDAALRAAATGCLDIAVRYCDPDLRPAVEAYAELIAAGRTPGNELADRAAATSPLAALEEEARA